jgi:large subunit ribosomal protein L10
LNKSEKELQVAEMRDRLKRAQAAFLVDYKGLNVEAMTKIRQELRKIGTEFCVVKNRLLKLASQGTQSESLGEYFAGPTALAIAYEDIVAPAKVLVEMSKEYDALNIRIGQISKRRVDSDGIRNLAQLPGRNELLAQAFSVMKEVPTSLVRVLNGVVINFLGVLKAIEAKKGGSE